MKKNAYVKVGVIVKNGNKILLIKERTDQNGPVLFNIVKGSPKIEDIDLEQAARRETREETGMEVQNCSVFSIQVVEKKNFDQVKIQFNFLASVTKNVQFLTSQNQEEDENIESVKWYTKREIELIAENQFVNNYTKALVMSVFNCKEDARSLINYSF